MIKLFISIFLVGLLWACDNASDKQVRRSNSATSIIDVATQTSIFNNLVSLTDNVIPENQLNDSLAFLVLPVKLSCAACRKKTIDSIVKHQDDLQERHFIIISGSEGRRNMNSYFKEVGKEMPIMENRLFLDTTNQAAVKKLVSENPVIYYTANQKAYKKVSAIPATVKNDLREFFSGTSNIDLSKK